jgi:hypothetical protein
LATDAAAKKSPKSLALIDFSAARLESVAAPRRRVVDFGNAIR